MNESSSILMPLDKTAERFRYYASTIYADRSPLYVNLAVRVAEDPEILGIAATTQEKAALPNLFFAAVHFLLLNGEHHQLAAFYPSLNSNSRHYEYVYPYFRSFVLEHAERIRDITTTHSVQTNEVGRCAVLVPAFEMVATQANHRPLRLIEIGSSAGLTLPWDRYYYRYVPNMECGDPNAPVRIECSLRGTFRPPVPRELPEVASRTGIDLSPIDVSDAGNVQWLRALVWPDNPKRAKLLEQAVEFVRQNPPAIMTGNALDLLPDQIAKAPSNEPLCIYHSFTLTVANKKPRDRLHRILMEASRKREISLVWIEWPTGSETPLLGLAKFRDGSENERILAKCHSHGEWLEWNDAASKPIVN